MGTASRTHGTLGMLLILVVTVASKADDAAKRSLREMINHLGSASFQQREAAMRGLIAAGKPAVEPLSKALGDPDAEVRSRVLVILGAISRSNDSETAGAAVAALKVAAQSDDESRAKVAAAALKQYERIAKQREAEPAGQLMRLATALQSDRLGRMAGLQRTY